MSLRAGPSVWAASAIAIGLTALAVWYIGGASWSADLGTIIQEAQRDLHGRLATAIRAVQDNRALALWNLVVLGFLYGIFHAAGPGHGKFVISTYVATTESGVRRGITLTLASSFLQGLTAIVVVEGAVRVLGLALRDARTGASAVETASYGLLALVGAGLAASAAFRLWHRLRGLPHHGHAHDSDDAPDRANGHGHEHGYFHSHFHSPDAASLSSPMKASHALAIVLSVGLRPCSGAVLVLLFAKIAGLTAAGIGAVAAISAGTALTVSALALLAVYARRAALAFGRRGGATARGLAAGLDAAAVAGGLIIVTIAISLFAASLGAVRHPLL
ncbi:MAG: hypothetical protein RL477_837 [Pseudomonadota bacterium]|jgi:ABC-type nickel/cobalt efflux system permease component RcnA